MEIGNPFEGKVALVTGAAGAIGQATSVLLAELGAKVIGVDRTDDWFIDHPFVTPIQADLEEPAEIYKLMDAVTTQEGRIDFLVHCMGLSITERWDEIRGDHIRKQLWVNTMSAIHITTQAANLMEGMSGHIVLFGSGAEQQCSVGHSVYAACKAGVRAFAEAIAPELKSINICVNVIWPSARSEMNPSSIYEPEDVAKFICGLFMTQKYGYVFSVAGDTIMKVEPREMVLLDSVSL
jgi:NAD(P)-dependent dehydrogenase (short-subunit alcohol dehydrogenase family)